MVHTPDSDLSMALDLRIDRVPGESVDVQVEMDSAKRAYANVGGGHPHIGRGRAPPVEAIAHSPTDRGHLLPPSRRPRNAPGHSSPTLGPFCYSRSSPHAVHAYRLERDTAADRDCRKRGGQLLGGFCALVHRLLPGRPCSPTEYALGVYRRDPHRVASGFSFEFSTKSDREL